jgi:iron complex outermembrane recepter protein
MNTRKALISGICLLAFANPAMAQEGGSEKLLDLSLDQLMSMEVTSVSKKAEKASEAPAAVYVVTQEDIKRTGSTSIPEALRSVPGLNVAQIGNHKWAVSSRGFNDQYSNKLLVMIDGRTVYTPLFAGTYWDVQDTPLEDIERIEVIRGPGATLWGANAVNGVINIITKTAKDTQGGLVSVTAGTTGVPNSMARYGGKIEDTAYRVYAQQVMKDELRTMSNSGADDEYTKTQMGFRADTAKGNNNYTVQGDVSYLNQDALLALPTIGSPTLTNREDTYNIGTGNVLGRWTHGMGEDGETSLQVYLDYFRSNSFPYDHVQKTADVDFQHSITLAKKHEMVWGVGYRLVADDIDGTTYVDFTPNNKTANLFTLFAQDKVALQDDVFLTFGSKFEHNDYTGLEYQPSARLSWLIDDKQNAWASVSRALRTPSRTADGMSFITHSTVGVRLKGLANVESEKMIAYEAGYRIQPTEQTSVDVATFYNEYDSLNNFVADGSALLQNTVNTGKGYTWGGEISGSWSVNKDLRFSAGYSYLQMKLEGASLVTSNSKSPQQQINARAYYNITDDVTWDNMVYFVDNIQPLSTVSIDQYVRYDTRLAWKAMEGIEVALIGQNLLDDYHSEFSGAIYNYQTQIPRAVYANVAWKF